MTTLVILGGFVCWIAAVVMIVEIVDHCAHCAIAPRH